MISDETKPNIFSADERIASIPTMSSNITAENPPTILRVVFIQVRMKPVTRHPIMSTEKTMRKTALKARNGGLTR